MLRQRMIDKGEVVLIVVVVQLMLHVIAVDVVDDVLLLSVYGDNVIDVGDVVLGDVPQLNGC